MSFTDIYKAMADESRLRILHILRHGHFNVQELTSVLALSQPTISHHLKILQTVGLVKGHKAGTWTYYSLVPSGTPAPSAAIAHTFLDLASAEQHAGHLEGLTDDRAAIASLLDRKRDDARSYFDSVAGNWKQIRSEALGPEVSIDELARRIPPEAALLELGCGSGALLERILPRPGKTIGVDYSQAMLDEARRNLARGKGETDLRLGYLEHLPIGDESIDIAAAYMVLHHVIDPREALRDVRRVLKPGGQLLAVDLLRHDDERMRERYADIWLGFDTAELAGWLEECGFSEIEISPLGDAKKVLLLTCIKPETIG